VRCVEIGACAAISCSYPSLDLENKTKEIWKIFFGYLIRNKIFITIFVRHRVVGYYGNKTKTVGIIRNKIFTIKNKSKANKWTYINDVYIKYYDIDKKKFFFLFLIQRKKLRIIFNW